jgi:hypothetical protein
MQFVLAVAVGAVALLEQVAVEALEDFLLAGLLQAILAQ